MAFTSTPIVGRLSSAFVSSAISAGGRVTGQVWRGLDAQIPGAPGFGQRKEVINRELIQTGMNFVATLAFQTLFDGVFKNLHMSKGVMFEQVARLGANLPIMFAVEGLARWMAYKKDFDQDMQAVRNDPAKEIALYNERSQTMWGRLFNGTKRYEAEINTLQANMPTFLEDTTETNKGIFTPLKRLMGSDKETTISPKALAPVKATFQANPFSSTALAPFTPAAQPLNTPKTFSQFA